MLEVSGVERGESVLGLSFNFFNFQGFKALFRPLRQYVFRLEKNQDSVSMLKVYGWFLIQTNTQYCIGKSIHK